MVKQNGEEEKQQQQQHTFLMVLLAKGKGNISRSPLTGLNQRAIASSRHYFILLVNQTSKVDEAFSS